MDQPGKVANPARGQLNRENNIPLSPCVPENLVSRDGFSRPVPRQPAHLHTQAESGAYLRDSSRVPRRRPFMKPPYAIGSVPSLSDYAITYRWRSLPRVRRHRASKPQGSSERVLPWQITMDQLLFASLSHTHYWYEVSMLKVPADLYMYVCMYVCTAGTATVSRNFPNNTKPEHQKYHSFGCSNTAAVGKGSDLTRLLLVDCTGCVKVVQTVVLPFFVGARAGRGWAGDGCCVISSI